MTYPDKLFSEEALDAALRAWEDQHSSRTRQPRVRMRLALQAAFKATRNKHSDASLSRHAGYCSLPEDHTGPCAATFTRDIQPKHSEVKGQWKYSELSKQEVFVPDELPSQSKTSGDT